jgi:methyl-accepting chemotaxis protein
MCSEKDKRKFDILKPYKKVGTWVWKKFFWHWFSNLKIGAKLILGFVVVAIIAGMIGLTGTVMIGKISRAGYNVYEMNVAVLGPLHRVATMFHKIRNDTHLHLTESTARKQYESVIKSNEASIDAVLVDFEKIIKGNELVADEVHKLYDIIQEYWKIEGKVLKLSSQNKIAEANQEIKKSLEVKANMIDNSIDSLFQKNDVIAQFTTEVNYKAAQNTIWLMLALAGIGLLAAVGFGILIARLIGKPLKQLTAAAEQLATGDVGVNITGVNGRDETAILTNVFVKMVASIREATGVAEQLAVGNLDVTVNVKSENDVLAKSMTIVIQNLRALISETGKLTAAASQGQLEVRGAVEEFSGEYRDVVEGFNRTLDAITAPLTEAGIVLGKMAVNDYTTAMTGEYQGLLKEFAAQINLVREQVLNVQDVFTRVSEGDISRLTEFRVHGKRSENDQLSPAMLLMMQAIQDLITETEAVATAAARGDLQVRGNSSKLTGKYQDIVVGINNVLDQMSRPIAEALTILEEMAQGNLDRTMTGNYQGDYVRLQEALNGTIRSFNLILGEINAAADQVATASGELSTGSQVLSQGASEQAATIEQLSAAVETIDRQIKQNASQAAQTAQLASKTGQNASQGNEQMQEMLAAMQQIDEAGANIAKIIKAIDEIAFQTNILALNAAIEAARAGQYGKGFAVVAEEVRNLAGRSARAAKETADLIAGSTSKTADGMDIANRTAASLRQIVSDITESGNLINEIAQASKEQAVEINEINQGINQVAQVTQTNTATAEESSASSEKLLNQAEKLRRMVGKFRLTNSLPA